MRHVIRLLILALALLSLPSIAYGAAVVNITVTASTATWTGRADLAIVNEAKDALLWQRESMGLLGAVFTAALPNISITNNGDGTGTLSIAMPRAGLGFDTWGEDYAVSHCPEAITANDKLTCVAEAIRADLRQVIYRYRHHLREQSNPIVEPDL